MVRTIAHLSDLHLGRSAPGDAEVRRIARALARARADTVVVSGDLTHRGRRAELLAFEEAFAPLLEAGRVVVVPGNHDRSGDDVGAGLMGGARVTVVSRPGLHLVCVDSTAPHNRRLMNAHGRVGPEDLAALDGALDAAPREALVAIVLHHHVLPLPADDLGEALAEWLGWPHSSEIPEGDALLALARGRCDLVLHGHRHVPSVRRPFPSERRALSVVNPGSAPDLGRVRRYHHDGARFAGMDWLDLRVAAPLAAAGPAARPRSLALSPREAGGAGWVRGAEAA